MLQLHTLPSIPTRKRKKRVGRGNASGSGTTAGRGTKGQRARTGGRKHIHRRSIKSLVQHLPKLRGFRALGKTVPGIPLDQILERLPEAKRIGIVELKSVGLLARNLHRYKVIGGAKARAVTILADGFSDNAKAAIEQAGGVAKLTPPRA